MARVSVIIPCYNSIKYIERCLLSFEQQTYKDFDIILIDDCSKDGTADFVSEYAARSELKITVLKNDVNLGPSLSREKGIYFSKSEFVAFCDSDDWYDNTYIEKMLSKADEISADMVFCGYKTIRENKGELITVEHRLKNLSTLSDCRSALKINVDSLCILLVRRSIIQQVKGPDIRNGEDMAIIPVVISKSQRFGAVDECLYNYFYRQGSASMTANEKVLDSLIKSFDYIKLNIFKEYRAECEFIGINNLIYGALLCLFKFSFNRATAKELLKNFQQEFPNWYKNDSIKSLPLYRRAFLWAASNRLFLVLKILSYIHTILTRNN